METKGKKFRETSKELDGMRRYERIAESVVEGGFLL